MEQTNPLNEGDAIPAFTFRENDGAERSSQELAGSPFLILIFYLNCHTLLAYLQILYYLLLLIQTLKIKVNILQVFSYKNYLNAINGFPN